MKQLCAILALAGAITTIGCSKTQSTSVIAFKWNTGQHENCVYAHENIYCMVPEQWPIDPETKGVSWNQVSKIPYRAEQERSELAKDPTAEAGTFDVKYSGSPMDFSLWDCFKTGVGSPAIQCDLKRKPSQAEIAQATEDEKKQKEHDALALKAHYFLEGLTKENLIQFCGAGKSSPGLISEKIAYSDKDGNPDSMFEYSTYGSRKGSLQNIEMAGTKPVHWYNGSKIWKDDALMIVQTMPCLAKSQK
jgi:hypothetical protein